MADYKCSIPDSRMFLLAHNALFARPFAVQRKGKRKQPFLAIYAPITRKNLVSKSFLVTPAGFEPAIFWMRTRYPRPLDDGASSKSTVGFHEIIKFNYFITPSSRFLLSSFQTVVPPWFGKPEN